MPDSQFADVSPTPSPFSSPSHIFSFIVGMIKSTPPLPFTLLPSLRLLPFSPSLPLSSTFLVSLTNKFGQMGGFDKIIQRISNIENWTPIETLNLLVTVVGNLSAILHRDFANDSCYQRVKLTDG